MMLLNKALSIWQTFLGKFHQISSRCKTRAQNTKTSFGFFGILCYFYNKELLLLTILSHDHELQSLDIKHHQKIKKINNQENNQEAISLPNYQQIYSFHRLSSTSILHCMNQYNRATITRQEYQSLLSIGQMIDKQRLSNTSNNNSKTKIKNPHNPLAQAIGAISQDYVEIFRIEADGYKIKKMLGMNKKILRQPTCQIYINTQEDIANLLKELKQHSIDLPDELLSNSVKWTYSDIYFVIEQSLEGIFARNSKGILLIGIKTVTLEHIELIFNHANLELDILMLDIFIVADFFIQLIKYMNYINYFIVLDDFSSKDKNNPAYQAQYLMKNQLYALIDFIAYENIIRITVINNYHVILIEDITNIDISAYAFRINKINQQFAIEDTDQSLICNNHLVCSELQHEIESINYQLIYLLLYVLHYILKFFNINIEDSVLLDDQLIELKNLYKANNILNNLSNNNKEMNFINQINIKQHYHYSTTEISDGIKFYLHGELAEYIIKQFEQITCNNHQIISKICKQLAIHRLVLIDDLYNQCHENSTIFDDHNKHSSINNIFKLFNYTELKNTIKEKYNPKSNIYNANENKGNLSMEQNIEEPTSCVNLGLIACAFKYIANHLSLYAKNI